MHLPLRASRVRPRFVALLALAALACGSAGTASGARLARAEARPAGRGAEIALSGPGMREVKAKAFTLGRPARLIVDLTDTVLTPRAPRDLSLRLPGVTGVRLAQYRTAPDVTRLVFTLAAGAPPPSWRLAPGEGANETRLLLQPAGPVTLSPPVVEKQKQSWVVRIPGVGYLERRTGALDNPARVFLDFTNAEVPATSGRNISAGPIAQVRMGQQSPEGEQPVARVAIELRASQAFDEKVEGEDVVVSFTEVAGREKRSPGPRGSYDVPLPPEHTVPSLRGKHIVVDPGHGGGDPGTQWPTADGVVCESDLTLAIGLKLERLLKRAGAKVTLTRREGDPYVYPSERRDLTNRLGPDAFVAIHCNSVAASLKAEPPKSASGTEVYYTSEDSEPLAKAVLEEVAAELETRDRGVRHTTELAVVNHACCPAVLVEVGFITDKDDRARLTDEADQGRAAAAILRGLARFFAEEERE